MPNRYQDRIEQLEETLDLLILPTLESELEHGYGISQAIRANLDVIRPVDTGSLYPALRCLERQERIAAGWRTSENKRRLRVCRRTKRGKRQLLSERLRWEPISGVTAGALNPAGRESSL